VLPIPWPELAARIGGAFADYRDIGAAHRAFVESVLPEDWSFEGKSVLDFGCGTGRTLSAFEDLAERASFVGCDIHGESIAWADSELSPPFKFFLSQETPPLAQPDESFDLIYAMSVFTHITDQWSQWLAELRRVMRPEGIAVISVLGPAMSHQILGSEWDQRIGMATVDLHKNWDVGGPDVLLGEWWVREHWGRAFEILRFERCDPAAGAGHDLVVMRRREVDVTPGGLVKVDLSDPREYASVACNLELVLRQQLALGDELREQQAGRLAAELRARAAEGELGAAQSEVQRLQAERELLLSRLDVVTHSNSWRLTAPLRRAMAGVRRSS
jgi:SAM-dependent methyltransferase